MTLSLLAGTLACGGTSDEAAAEGETAPSTETCAAVASAPNGDRTLSSQGMTEGDALRQVDGSEMSSPEAALEAYARLRAAARCAQQRREGEEPVVIDFETE